MMNSLEEKLSLDYQIHHSPKQAFHVFTDEVVIMNIEAGHYFTLNRIGSDIWQFISEPKSYSQLLEYLKQKYEVESQVLQKETCDLIKKLAGYNLITLTQ